MCFILGCGFLFRSRRSRASSRLTILPVPVLGSAVSPNWKRRGILNLAMRCWRNSQRAGWSSVWPGLTTTKAAGHFAPLRVGRRDHGAFQHGGVGGDGALHFDGGNVFAAGDDDVLLAVHDVDVVLFVPHGHVAGVQPAVGHDGGGGLRLLVVAVHDVVAAHDDLAEGLHVARHVVHLQIHHAHFAAGQRPAGHGAVAQAVLLVGELHGGFVARAGGDGRGFGEAVAGHRGAGKYGFQAGDQFGRGGRAAEMDLAQAGDVVVAEFRAVEQRVGHGGHQRHGGGLLFLDQAQHVSGIEAPHHHLLEAVKGGALRAAPAVGVEERDGVQLDHGLVVVEGGRDGRACAGRACGARA